MSGQYRSIVDIKGLGKSYHGTPALTDINLTINEGECFGLLGPNGAGKSTLIKLIYGVVAKSAGEISVLGFDPEKEGKQLRKHLGVVMQDDALDEAMTARDNMLMFCRFHGYKGPEAAKRIDELMESMSIGAKSQAKISSLSGGVRRRLAFVRSLLSSPKLLILDEPTTGLDPAVRHALWDKMRELKRSGTTIILTTHYMDEAELLCDRLVLIDQGKIKTQGSPKDLIREYCAGYLAVFYDENGNSKNSRRKEYASLEELSTAITLETSAPQVIRPANLEDVFLKLTGRDFEQYD